MTSSRRSRASQALVALAVAGAGVWLPLTATDAFAAARLAPSRIAVHLSAQSVVVGEGLTTTIVLTPRAVGRMLVLERRGAHRWRNIARAVTNSRGRATITLNLKTVGTFRLRAITPATTVEVGLNSRVVSVAVTPVPPPYAGKTLQSGDSGPLVLALQQRLSSLGYWLGTPDSYFGDATIQAVYAFQKAAKLNPTGVVGPTTVTALQAGVLPLPRSKTGTVVEIDLQDDLLMFVDNGVPIHILNTSTGGGYTYTQDGATLQAITPTGVFHIYRAVNGLVTDTLGQLWRPRFFYEGYAIHGDSYVPSVAESHGCARVSNEAINWIWANNLLPMGMEVWVY